MTAPEETEMVAEVESEVKQVESKDSEKKESAGKLLIL